MGLRDWFIDPPLDFQGSTVTGWVWTAMMVVAFAVSLTLMVRWSLRERTWLWVILLAAGGLMFFGEPIGDWWGATWYPTNSPLVVGDILGRPMPFYLVLTYLSYPVLGFWLCYRVLTTDVSRAAAIRLWVAGSIFNCFFEMVMVHFRGHVYYGDNPVLILGLPAYSIVQNGAFMVVGGAILMYAKLNLRGLQQLWLILLIPMSLGIFAVATTPMYIALNAPASQPVKLIAGVLSTILNLALGYAIISSRHFSGLQERASAQDSEERQAERSGRHTAASLQGRTRLIEEGT